MEIKDFDGVTSPFHTNLNRTLDLVAENLHQALDLVDVDCKSKTQRVPEDAENSVPKECLSQAEDNFNVVLGNLRAFLTSINLQTARLNTEAEHLAEEVRQLETDKDTLDEKGHELHCRIGYNALEKVLEDTLYSMHSHTSLQSAECFKDEAEETLKRTVSLLRLARLRSSQLDTDIFTETKKIVQLFEEYDKERGDYVKELDLLDDIKRCKLSAWLNESQDEEDKQKVSSVLDLIRLSERRRHLNLEVIQAALRMDSFNTTLDFDRKANMDKMEKLTSKLEKVNNCTGVKDILPRAANAMTDLTSLVTDCKADESDTEGKDIDIQADTPDDSTCTVQPKGCVGHGLHRCPKKLHLATDPVTDPHVLAHLELALRWDQNDGVVFDERENESKIVALKTVVKTSNHVLQWGARNGDSAIIGQGFNAEEGMRLEACKDDTPEGDVIKDLQSSPTRKPSAFHHHVESSNMLPDSADSQMAGLVMKRPKDGRPVSSLTDIEKTNSMERESCSEA